MKIVNKITGEDVSDYFTQLMQGKITNRKFEYLAGITERNMSAKAQSEERKLKVN